MTMEKIKDLVQLKYNLSLGPGYGGYNDLLKAVDFADEELEKYVQFTDESYQRIRLYDTTLIEAVLSCWQPSQEGEIHNLNGSAAWFKVLSGQVVLENYDLTGDSHKLKYKQNFKVGEQCFLDDELGFHRFKNGAEERAVILHLYSEKLVKRKVYDPNKAQFCIVKARVDNNFDD